MKRTQVDPKKLKLKRRAIVQLGEKQLEAVTGGCHDDTRSTLCSGSDTRLCHGS